MKRYNYDVIIIGGGPAGMASFLECVKEGCKTLLVDREKTLGGILKQCIHSGFGLHYLGKELTGPEYAYEFIKQIKALEGEKNAEVLTETFVIDVEENHVTIKNAEGVKSLSAKSIILATGARERTAGAIALTGERPSGVWTAGQAQKWVNNYGYLPCKCPVILGSGDIGLIMARRLTYEGAKPKMVLELEGTTSGLARNIKQCLKDLDIPLYLNTTVTEVLGYPKITGVIIANVDENKKPIKGTERKVDCDGLILSVGLIPETDLISKATINPKTNSVMVNEFRECSSIKNLFVCGNAMHVHDLVDYVTKESIMVGRFASQNAKGNLNKNLQENKLISGSGVRYTIPNTYYEGEGTLEILFRVTKRFTKSELWVIDTEGNLLFKKFILSASMGEMQSVTINKELLKGDITLMIKEKGEM